MFKRLASEQISKFIGESTSPHQVLIVQGARQVGKTTTLNGLLREFPNVLSSNLERDRVLRDSIDKTVDFTDFEKQLQNTLGFDSTREQILFIDEAQESTQLGSYVRFMKEQWPNTKCILTGSSMKRLYRVTDRVPVGRTAKLLLTPLNFREFLAAREQPVLLHAIEEFASLMRPPSPILHEQLLNEFDRYLLSGGLPEVVKAFNKDHDYEAVAKDILIEQEEDFVRKESVTKIDLFQDSLRAVANSLGSQFKLTTTDHKYHDAKKIMNLLSSWKLVYLIEQKSTVPNTKMSPKMYMYDLGIASQLRNMPFPQIGLLESKDPTLRIPLGGLFENAVLIELMSDTLGRLTISSWRKKSGTDIEVDFVWRHKNQLIPIECKATLNATKRHFKNLVHYNKFTGSTCGFLISAAPYRTFKHGAFKLVNLPIYLVQSSNLLREYSQ